MNPFHQDRSDMADIRAFPGFRYAVKTPGDLSRFVAPPYDMIDGAMIDALYQKDPCNVVRVIQNKKEAADRENRDRHVRAAGFLDAWIKSGVLRQDPSAGVYAYAQDFALHGGDKTAPYRRTAVIALVKLEDYDKGVIHPHEYTLTGPKVDRYELFSASATQSELIFGIVPDDGSLYRTIAACAQGDAVGSFESEGGVTHTLYRTADETLIGTLTEAMKSRTILIADGHHRYETCLKYFRDTKNPAAAYAVMALVSMADPGLVIRPFHRLVRKSPGALASPMEQSLSTFFDVSDLGPAKFSRVQEFLEPKSPAPSGHEMLFCDTARTHLWGLSLNAMGHQYLKDNPHGMSLLWNRLNVSTINSIVVNRLLGLPLDGTVLHDLIDYVNDPAAAFSRVTDPQQRSAYRGGFFIRPLDIAAVNAVVSGGERMPQKSTNFFPKCFSGLVFYRMGNS
jgi:uncharacterized protein (DUF1015 family)